MKRIVANTPDQRLDCGGLAFQVLAKVRPSNTRWLPIPLAGRRSLSYGRSPLGLSLVHTNMTLKRLQKTERLTLAEGQLKLANPAALARLADYRALPLRASPLICPHGRPALSDLVGMARANPRT